MRHATIANEQPASTTSEAAPASSGESAKPALRRKAKRKVRAKPTARRGTAAKPRGRTGGTAAKVAKLLAKGIKPPAIAKRLGLSDVTVYYHKKRIDEAQHSESRALVPAKTRTRAVLQTSTETPTAEVLDAEIQPRVTSLGLTYVLEAKKAMYEKHWRDQTELSWADRRICDAVDEFFGR